MNTFKKVIVKKFILLSVGVTAIIVLLAYQSVSSIYSNYKIHAMESSKILADNLESTVMFEAVEDFEAISQKMDFKNTYSGVSIYRQDGTLFATKGRQLDNFTGDQVQIIDQDLQIRQNIISQNNVIGTLVIAQKLRPLINALLKVGAFIIISLSVLLLLFYLYNSGLNKKIVGPINKLKMMISSYKQNDLFVLDRSTTKILEIDEFKSSFNELVVKLRKSESDLLELNSNLQLKVDEKTAKLSAALDEMKRYQKRIVAQEKLASLGGLSAGIAHEIKNPLNLILNSAVILSKMSNSLKGKSSLNEKDLKRIEEVCRIIEKSSKRADRIIKGMLSQARSKTSRQIKCNLSEVCKEAVNLAYHAMRGREDSLSLIIETKIEDNINLTCYPDEIERVIINMLNNSFDALRDKIKADDKFVPELIVTLEKHANILILKVYDNGSGIPEEIIEKVKEPFFTTKDAGKGTGLGLSMINDIVTAQNGKLEINSMVNEYTEIQIIFSRKSEAKHGTAS